MNIPLNSLQMQHTKICMKLNSLGNLLLTQQATTPWWELLLSTKELLKDCVDHSALTMEYRDILGPTHWILNNVLSLLVLKSDQAEHLASVMSDIIKAQLAYPEQLDEAADKLQLVELVQNIRMALQLEENIAYEMLDILQNQPQPSTPDNSTTMLNHERNHCLH